MGEAMEGTEDPGNPRPRHQRAGLGKAHVAENGGARGTRKRQTAQLEGREVGELRVRLGGSHGREIQPRAERERGNQPVLNQSSGGVIVGNNIGGEG